MGKIIELSNEEIGTIECSLKHSISLLRDVLKSTKIKSIILKNPIKRNEELLNRILRLKND